MKNEQEGQCRLCHLTHDNPVYQVDCIDRPTQVCVRSIHQDRAVQPDQQSVHLSTVAQQDWREVQLCTAGHSGALKRRIIPTGKIEERKALAPGNRMMDIRRGKLNRVVTDFSPDCSLGKAPQRSGQILEARFFRKRRRPVPETLLLVCQVIAGKPGIYAHSEMTCLVGQSVYD